MSTNQRKRSHKKKPVHQKASIHKRSHHSAKLPKTRKVLSHKSKQRALPSRAHSNMSITDLQYMAKSKGIPFGGLKKTQLIQKINMA